MSKKYKVVWSKTYHVSGEVEIGAVSEAHAVQRVQDEMGGYEGSMQYDPKYDYVEVVEEVGIGAEVNSIVTEMAEDLLAQAEKMGYKRFPTDFDGAHHVNKKEDPCDHIEERERDAMLGQDEMLSAEELKDDKIESQKMKTYEVEFTSSTFRTYYIDAKSESEANERAIKVLGEDFEVSPAWKENAEINYIEQIGRTETPESCE